MPISDEFLEYVLDQLSNWDGITYRKMFGGAGIYRNGKIFAIIADDELYLKVDDSNRAEFIAAGCTQFKPFDDKPMLMSYYEVPPEVLEQPSLLIEWSTRSLEVSK